LGQGFLIDYFSGKCHLAIEVDDFVALGETSSPEKAALGVFKIFCFSFNSGNIFLDD
jgi:hypothetical protein